VLSTQTHTERALAATSSDSQPSDKAERHEELIIAMPQHEPTRQESKEADAGTLKGMFTFFPIIITYTLFSAAGDFFARFFFYSF
jgi:hypothetical protein